MVGSSADGLPGVPAVGPKTATDLLCRYRSIDGVYTRLSDLRPRLREAFEDNYRQLAVIPLLGLLSDASPFAQVLDRLIVATTSDRGTRATQRTAVDGPACPRRTG